MNPTHLEQIKAYIEQNPLRAGICGLPSEYRWSSAYSGRRWKGWVRPEVRPGAAQLVKARGLSYGLTPLSNYAADLENAARQSCLNLWKTLKGLGQTGGQTRRCVVSQGTGSVLWTDPTFKLRYGSGKRC